MGSCTSEKEELLGGPAHRKPQQKEATYRAFDTELEEE